MTPGVVLYNPPSSANRKPVVPMSLLALGVVLEEITDYAIVDGNLASNSLQAIRDALSAKNADILIVTVMPGPQLHAAVPLCRQLKEERPDLTIIWGGYFPTQHYESCLASSYVDYVVRGHGELVLAELIKTLRSAGDISSIQGVAYRDGTNAAVSNPMAPIPSPDKLPDFPYERVDMLRYVRPTFMGKRTLPHHSSYGCPFLCNFCAVVNMVNGRWLAQSAERTANVAGRLVRDWGVDAVEFYDNNFFVHEARTAEFSDRIRHLNISWWGESRIDTMMKYSDRTWLLMQDSGLRMVFLGAESGSNETLKRMNKGGTASIEKTLEIAEKMRRHNIVPEFSFVLGNPPDPEDDVAETIDFIRRVKRVNPRSEIILYMYTPVPLAGELYEQAKAQGFAFPATLDEWVGPDWQEFSQRRSAHTPWMRDPLRNSVREFERVLNAYYPTATDKRLNGTLKWVLRAASAWRYHLRFYSNPIELRALQRLIAYQRPETSGF